MDIQHPIPEEMVAALLSAAEAGRWNHWGHEVRQHASDWRDAGDVRQPLTATQFAQLPILMARHPSVELAVYGYRDRPVWGFFCKSLPFEGKRLSWVLVVYDPVAGEIIHCMRPRLGKRYCERWGEQTRLFEPVRWRE